MTMQSTARRQALTADGRVANDATVVDEVSELTQDIQP